MPTALEEVKAGRQFDTWLQDQMKDDVPCEWDTPTQALPCPTPAAWRLQMPCCGFPVNLCGQHREKWLAVARRLANPYCMACGQTGLNMDDVTWTEI